MVGFLHHLLFYRSNAHVEVESVLCRIFLLFSVSLAASVVSDLRSGHVSEVSVSVSNFFDLLIRVSSFQFESL